MRGQNRPQTPTRQKARLLRGKWAFGRKCNTGRGQNYELSPPPFLKQKIPPTNGHDRGQNYVDFPGRLLGIPPFFLIQMGGTGAKKMSIILAATGITFSAKGSLPP